MKIFFYDLETTGTLFWKHGIHQISGAIVIDGEVKERFDLRVAPNPKAIVEDAALQVAGVTREQIMAYPPMGDVYNK
ncbi:MAG: 3'-5' exonuclease, partial [Bacteroidaceae bacterium]|nr:3'-5' exonuclease [Bacteroidaceae bacterium]